MAYGYLVFVLPLYHGKNGTTVYEIAKSLLSIPLTAQGNGFMVYVYPDRALYTCTHHFTLVTKASQKEVAFILALWGYHHELSINEWNSSHQ